jgi:hypothetical protein
MNDDDLDYVYVLVDPDDQPGGERELLTARQMSDKQFREWIVAKGQQHGISVLPTFGRIGHEQRLRLINYLIRKGAPIYRAPKQT